MKFLLCISSYCALVEEATETKGVHFTDFLLSTLHFYGKALNLRGGMAPISTAYATVHSIKVICSYIASYMLFRYLLLYLPFQSLHSLHYWQKLQLLVNSLLSIHILTIALAGYYHICTWFLNQWFYVQIRNKLLMWIHSENYRHRSNLSSQNSLLTVVNVIHKLVLNVMHKWSISKYVAS